MMMLQDRAEGVDEGDERGIADLLLDQVGLSPREK